MATAFDLRPLQFGDHLGRSFSIFLRHWVSLARWYGLTFVLPVVAVTLVMNLVLRPYAYIDNRMVEPSMFEPNASAAYWWLMRLVALCVAHWFSAAGVIYMAGRIYVGDSPGFVETAKAVLSRGGHLTATAFVYLVGLAGILVLCIGPGFLIGQGGRNSAVQGWLYVIFVGVPAAFFALAFFIGRFGLCLSCVMLDDADATAAFHRSSQLSKRFRWRLAMLVMVAAIITGVPGLWSVLDIPGIVGRALLESSGLPMVGDVLYVCWQGLLAPLFLLPTVVFFFDQRCRKEGYDLAVMARNFGIDEGQLLRFQMDPMLGYIPKGYKHDPNRPRLVPQAARVQAQPVMAGWPAQPQQGWPQQPQQGWPAQPQQGWPQQPQQGWPAQPQQGWPQRPQPVSPRPAAQPRVFRPPQRKGGA